MSGAFLFSTASRSSPQSPCNACQSFSLSTTTASSSLWCGAFHTTTPTDRVIGLSPLQVQRRFTAAARAAGIEAHLTAHSGRVGLASELTARGASTTEVMLAGNWRTARMVAHYSAGATAERGAVAKYL